MKRFLYILLFIIVAALICIGSLTVSHRCLYKHPEPAKGRELSIVSYNTQRMNAARKADKNEVIKYILQTDADVVCLQEVDVYKNNKYITLSELRNALRRYPYTYFDFKVYNSRRQYGNAVFSRYPLTGKHTIEYDSRANITSCCDVCVGDDTIRLFVNHLESNRIAQKDIDSVMQTGSLKHGNIISKLRKASMFRTKQAEAVKKTVGESPYPCLVVGDFNAPPFSLTYLKMSRGMKDCFLYCSNGKIGNTWVYNNIGVRIDYILCSETLLPRRFSVDKVQGSDHYPVRATVVW